jgi:LacI family transcriptional regulator
VKYGKATYRQIAAEAGVSAMAVHYAIRNQPGVSSDTRKRILASAKKLGYQPNALVAALQTQSRRGKNQQRGNVIAFVTAGPTEDSWRIHQAYFDGAVQRARQLGFRLEVIWAKQPGMTGVRLSKILFNRGIPGLLLAPLAASRGHLTLDWSRFAVATLGQSLWRPKIHRAMTDLTQTLVNALARLKNLGYRRIGMVTQKRTNERTNFAYSMPFWDFYQRLDSDDFVPPLLTIEGEGKVFLQEFVAWVEAHRPEVIISNLKDALDYWRSLPERKKRKLKFVYLTGTDLPEDVCNIFLEGNRVGAQAVDLLVEQLKRNETGLPTYPKTVMVEGRWLEQGEARDDKEDFLPSGFSMQTVAARIGVSRMTVSRALADSPLVSEKTKKRVLAAADELGYRVHPMVSALMSQMRATKRTGKRKAPQIGLIFPGAAGEFEEQRKGCLAGARARAREQGYQLKHFELNRGEDLREMEHALRKEAIRGLIVGPWLYAKSRLRLDWTQFACVALGYSIVDPPLHRVILNSTQAMLDTVRQLRRLGYRRVALHLGSRHNERTGRLYPMAFWEFQTTQPEESRIEPYFYGRWDKAGFLRFVKRRKPDAVISDSGLAYHALREAGFNVPGDIGYVNLTSQGGDPTFAGLQYDGALVGSVAVDLVVEQLQRDEVGPPLLPKTLQIEGEWRPGATV